MPIIIGASMPVRLENIEANGSDSSVSVGRAASDVARSLNSGR